MEVYLYKCEVCGVAMFSNRDHGRVFYNDCCGICKIWTYYEKVMMKPAFDMFLNFQGNRFYVPTAEEYKKDGNSDTRANQKE